MDSAVAACAIVGESAAKDLPAAEKKADQFLREFNWSHFDGVTSCLCDNNVSVRRGAVVLVALSACNSYSHGYYNQQPECHRLLDGLVMNARYHHGDPASFRSYVIATPHCVMVDAKMVPLSEKVRYAGELAEIASGHIGNNFREEVRKIRAYLIAA